MMWQPEPILTDKQVQRAMRLVIADGLATETMTTLTTGTFLIAMLLLLNASNFQIGLIAALPAVANIFQLFSISLIRRLNNRRSITVICSLLGRTPLLIIGLILLLDKSITVDVVVMFLFLHYFFGSVAGPCWNAWMKDIIPENTLGRYFSRRTSYTQLLNIVLGLSVALAVDYVNSHAMTAELNVYAILFIAGGTAGICSSFFLSATPEPLGKSITGNIF